MLSPQYKQLINVHGIKLQPSDVHKSQPIAVLALLLAFLAIASFSQLLKHETDMVVSYCVYSALLIYNAVMPWYR